MAQKNFFKSLFDFSFREFITTRVIKFLFIVFVILAACGAVGYLITSIAGGCWLAFAAFIIAPVGFFFYVLIVRIWLEVLLVLFRIADNTDKMAGGGQAAESTASEAVEQ